MTARALESSLEVRPYRLRLRQPLHTARGSYQVREGFVVLAHEGGLTGRGEAAPLPELGTETLAQCADELRRASFEELPKTPAARHAVELALLDLRAQRAGVSLARLLDPGAPFEVQVSALLSARTMPELAREAQRAAAEGFATLKLKAGFDDDFARAAVVRDAVGPLLKLRLDANGAWPRELALRRLHELAALGIELCEQPTADLIGLRGETPVPIAADELFATDAAAALELADIVVLKPMVLGGVLAALRLGREAQRRGRRVFVTTSLDGAIGRAGAAHLAAALLADGPMPAAGAAQAAGAVHGAVGSQPAAGLATGRLFDGDLCPDLLAPRGGLIRISDAPGLGL